jgi:tetratricopeptide (TPR) repeat protein
VQAAAQELDPRVTSREGGSWFQKPNARQISKEYADAKANLKNPEKLMTAMARYQENVFEVQKNPQAMEVARQTYSTLLTDNPNSLNAMLGLARVDHKADRIADAERMYQTVAAKFPTDSTAMAAVAGFYNDTDRPKQAYELLPAAVERDPENRDLRQQIGIALVKSGRAEEAVEHFTKVEGQASAYATIGQLLANQKDFSGARDYLGRAIKRNPELPGVKTALAQLSSMGDIRQAGANALQNAQGQIRRAAGTKLAGSIE